MEFEEMKKAWNEQARALDASMPLNSVLLERNNLGTVERNLGTTLRGTVLQLVFDAAGLLLIGSFAGDHFSDLRYLLPAVLLWAFALALAIDGVLQIVALRSIDYDQPVLVIQERLLRLRAQRIKRVGWILAVAPLMWAPLAIVGFRGVFGVDVYGAFGSGYVLANVAFGLLVLAAALFVARRGQRWFERYPSVKSLMNDISGRSLTQALHALNSLVRFRNEDAAA